MIFNPQAPTHILLIIPKKHIPSLAELTERQTCSYRRDGEVAN